MAFGKFSWNWDSNFKIHTTHIESAHIKAAYKLTDRTVKCLRRFRDLLSAYCTDWKLNYAFDKRFPTISSFSGFLVKRMKFANENLFRVFPIRPGLAMKNKKLVKKAHSRHSAVTRKFCIVYSLNLPFPLKDERNLRRN